MSKADALKEQIATTRFVLDSTLKDISQEDCMRRVSGTVHPIGSLYAHWVLSEDFVVNMVVRGAAPLMMSTYAGKSGMSEPYPMPGSPDDQIFAWANRVQIDLPALREYDKAVRAATDDYLSSASDEELSRKIDWLDMGDTPVSTVLGLICIVHPSNHIGEVSALKGIFDKTGYGF